MKHLPLGILITLFALLGHCTPLHAQNSDTTIIPDQTPLFSCDFEASDAMNVWEQRKVKPHGGTWSRVSDIGNRWTARCKSRLQNSTHTWIISPNITLPADADGYYLRWMHRLVRDGSLKPTIEVRLAAAADTIADGAPTSDYSTVLYTKTGASNYESQQVSLAQYGGQMIRIAFVDKDSSGACSVFIDDVEIVPIYRPEITFTVPDSVEVGDTLHLTATVIQGYTTGMTVEWHSTMEARGEATLTYDSLQATIVYNTDGIDTIMVIANGRYGNDTSTATMRIPDPLRFFVPHTSIIADATRIDAPDTIGFKAVLTSGSSNGLGYTWSSTMVDRGEALLYSTASDDSVYIVYPTPGKDTVTVHTVNDFGQCDDTVTLAVCLVQDTLPWKANFINDFPCWQAVSGKCSVSSSGSLSFDDLGTMVVSPLVYVPNDGNVVLEYSCAYSFFYGSTLVMVTTDMTSYDTIANKPFTTGSHPATLLALDDYAGQYIRVAFKARGDILQYYLINVTIRYSMKPVVTLAVNDNYFRGPSVLTATLQEGDTTGLTYTWHSTLLDSTITLDSNILTLNYTQSGTDTVTVIATNAYGSDTALVVYNIIAQPEVTLQHTAAYMEEPTVFTAVLNRCISEGLTYTWHSAMLGDLNEYSEFDGFNGRCEVMYPVGGFDTVTVIVSTFLGADTVSAVVEVSSITSLPWTENFTTTISSGYNYAGGLPKCWRRYWNGTNINVSPHVVGDYYQYTNIQSYLRNNKALALQAGSTDGYDSVSFVETPPFEVPFAGNQLSFYCMYEQSNRGQLSVGYMQNGGFVSLAEIEPQTAGRTEYVMLDGMPADANRIAFKWRYVGGGWYGVILDNFRVAEPDSLPEVRLSSNRWRTYTGDTTTIRAQFVKGFTDSLRFSWHSSLMDTTIVTMDPVLSIVYNIEGCDTIILVATNAYGSSTATVNGIVLRHPLLQVDTLMVTSASLSAQFNAPIVDLYADWGYMNEFIYPASRLAGLEGSVIRGVQFHSNHQLSVFDETFTLSMQEVADSTCTETGWRHDSTALQQVWTGLVMIVDSLWTVWFDTPFTYSGGHLLFSSATNGLTYGKCSDGDFLCFNTGYNSVRWQPANSQHQLQETAYFNTYLPAIDFFYTPDSLRHTVTVSSNVDGICEPYGSGRYLDSSTVEIGYNILDTIAEGGYWRFQGWSDGGTGNPRQILVVSDTSIVSLFEWVPTQGIEETGSSRWNVEVFPNPASTDVTVRVSRPSTLTLLDLQGRTVIPSTTVNTQFPIRKSQLAPGTYFLRVTTDNNTLTKKLVIL